MNRNSSIINSLASHLQSKSKWHNNNPGQELVLTVEFLKPHYHDKISYSANEQYSHLTAFTPSQRQILQVTLNEIAGKTGLEFRMAESDEYSNLTFGNYNAKTNLLGFAYYPNVYRNDNSNSPVWINVNGDLSDIFKEVITHELGHALGLGHVNIEAGYSGSDSIMWPVATGKKDNFQQADILALQQLYGPDTHKINSNSNSKLYDYFYYKNLYDNSTGKNQEEILKLWNIAHKNNYDVTVEPVEYDYSYYKNLYDNSTEKDQEEILKLWEIAHKNNYKSTTKSADVSSNEYSHHNNKLYDYHHYENLYNNSTGEHQQKVLKDWYIAMENNYEVTVELVGIQSDELSYMA